MKAKYLAIEKDIAFHEKESAFWLFRNVFSIRVSSINEGIKEAMKRQLLYTGINADNINCKPQLPLLREATNDPIFISTSTYTIAYVSFNPTLEYARVLLFGSLTGNTRTLSLFLSILFNLLMIFSRAIL